MVWWQKFKDHLHNGGHLKNLLVKQSEANQNLSLKKIAVDSLHFFVNWTSHSDDKITPCAILVIVWCLTSLSKLDCITIIHSVPPFYSLPLSAIECASKISALCFNNGTTLDLHERNNIFLRISKLSNIKSLKSPTF